MSTSLNLTKGLTALSLSLGLLAGCAAPTSTTPAPGGATPEAAQPAAPAQPGATPAAPAMPAPAATAPMTLIGNATFRGEPLAGYTVTVLDAQTGQPVTLTNDLASAKGLAVLAQNLKTDAKGDFNLQVVGLGAGQALRVQVASGNGMLETVLTANGQSLGAKGYRVAQAGSRFIITELTTAIARVASGVLLTTMVLPPAAAAPVLAKLATEMISLSTQLEGALKSNPGLAGSLVSTEGTRGKEAVSALVANAGAVRALTLLVAGLVADVSKAAGSAVSDAHKAALTKVEFPGTVLAGALDAKGGFKLSNTLNGNTVDAGAAADLSSVTTQVSGGSGGGASAPVLDPNTAYVGTAQQLKDAIAGDKPTIKLTADISMASNEGITITRAVTLDGGDKTLSAENLTLTKATSTVKSLKLTGRLRLGNFFDFNIQQVSTGFVIQDSTFGGGGSMNVTEPVSLTNCSFGDPVSVDNTTQLTVEGCSFKSVSGTGTGLTLQGTLSQVSVTKSTFSNCDPGINASVHQNSDLTIKNNTFTTTADLSASEPPRGLVLSANDQASNTLSETIKTAVLATANGNTFNGFTNNTVDTRVQLYLD